MASPARGNGAVHTGGVAAGFGVVQLQVADRWVGQHGDNWLLQVNAFGDISIKHHASFAESADGHHATAE